MKGIGESMFERIKALFESGKLTAAQVRTAVVKGYITAAQADEILGVQQA